MTVSMIKLYYIKKYNQKITKNKIFWVCTNKIKSVFCSCDNLCFLQVLAHFQKPGMRLFASLTHLWIADWTKTNRKKKNSSIIPPWFGIWFELRCSLSGMFRRIAALHILLLRLPSFASFKFRLTEILEQRGWYIYFCIKRVLYQFFKSEMEQTWQAPTFKSHRRTFEEQTNLFCFSGLL